MHTFSQILIYGMINSATFILMASGFALVYSISRVPNFAHGGLYVIAAYFIWVILYKLGLPYIIATVLGLVMVTLIGILMYRFVLIRVRGMTLSEIIGSFAVGIGSLEFLRFVGLKGLSYNLPVFIKGKVLIMGVVVDYQRLLIICIAISVVVLFWAFTRFSRLGLSLKGVAQDERMAMLLGINSDKAAIWALSLGSALAGLAAVVLVPLGTIAVESGHEVLIYALAICVLGGLGSWAGAIAGSLIIGFAQTITSIVLGTQWHVVVALMAILCILIFKPSGLFGKQKELEERV